VLRRLAAAHLVQVAVAPHLPVHEGASQDASLRVELGPLAHAPPLQPDQLPGGRVRHVDHRQAAAGQPHGRPALGVVHDAQRELAVVVVDLLRPRVAVEIDGQEIAAVSLKTKKKEKKKREL